MEILIVSRGWPTNRDPKWGCFEKDHADALRALGHNIKVICLDCRFSFKSIIPKITNTIINGIEYTSYRGIPQVITSLLFGNKIAIRIEQKMILRLYGEVVKRDFKPDVVYSHFILNSAAASILKQYGLPLVIIEHSSELVKNKPRSIIIQQAKTAYNAADTLISVSDYLKNSINRRFGVNSTVIPNMIGQEFVTTLPPKQRISTGVLRFLSIGALIPRKGYFELIRAFSKANIKNKKWQLDIIGYGYLRRKLQILIDSLGLSSNIHLLGPKTKTEIISEMSTSDIFVLNTKRETFGVVYIEALSQGIPCIMTNCGGTEGIMSHEDGLSVPVDDELALIHAIEYMACHFHEYNRNDIRQRCLDKYSPKNVAIKIENILLETIKQCET